MAENILSNIPEQTPTQNQIPIPPPIQSQQNFQQGFQLPTITPSQNFKKTPNRLFYTVKLSSSILRHHKFEINLSFDECLKNGMIISLSDSQMLKTIRDITGKKIDRQLLETWYQERDILKKRKNSKENRTRIRQLQNQIYDMMYIPQYITVVMDSTKDYQNMYKHGFKFNGHTYRRGSCSASQARVSTIVFIDEEIKDELKRRLDCGRDLTKPLAPSKYNAYFGLYSSAIKEVRKPRFCIVPDYEVEMEHEVDFVIEKDKDSDDIIERRTVTSKENRFDGSGLISPQMAKLWGEDLGEDYTPCNFCLRYTFTKGMVNEFDFVEWCHEKNNDNYIIKDIWGKDIDLRNIDVILSEGQVKLWDSWPSQEEFERLSDENGIVFGITKYSPKQDKNVLMTNYQYLQTLKMNDEDIKALCADTIKYIQGVSYEDPYYSILFCMGENSDETSVEKFLKSSDNYWLKSLILDHNILNDKYSREKIRDMIVRRIELACLGRLMIKGNYQCICPDPYAYMEWICYRDTKPINGLLKAGEAYCWYWNQQEKVPEYVDAMRSPLTHFSEHGIDKLRNTEEMRKWYKYCYSGYINNIHDEFTYVHAGSDWDYDIISSTDNPQFVNGKYPNQRVVTYDVKKPHKKLFTEDDLFVTDMFSFGTQIGQITNTCSTICALMAEFPEDSEEYKLLGDRLKAGCAAQSRQIDKTKIGENVKTLGTICKQFQHIEPDDTEEEKARKKFYNSILADKKPYFFRYKYKQLSKDYNAYIKKTDQNAAVHLCTSLKELLEKEKLEQQGKATLTEEEKTFLFYYRKNLPVIDSDCVMNKICKYIESIDFHIKQKIKSKQDFDYKILLSENGFQINQKLYKEIKVVVEDFMKSWHSSIKSKEIDSDEKLQVQGLDQNKVDRDIKLQNLKYDLNSITSNEEQLCNHLVYLFYVDKPSYSKSTLWNICGREIYNNILKRTSVVYYPVKDDNGDIEFMYSKYSVKHVSTENLKKPEAYVYNDYSLGQEIFEDKDGEENYQFDKCFMILPKRSEDFSFKKIIYTTKGENPDD